MINKIRIYVAKVRSKGLLWTISRLRREVQSPTFPITRQFMHAILVFKRRVNGAFFNSKTNENDYVVAVYDLNVNAITFDIVIFLLGAEVFARKNNKKKFLLIVVPRGGGVELSETYTKVVDEQNSLWRFENIVLPIIGLWPACTAYAVLPRDSELFKTAIRGNIIYPEFYSEKFTPGLDYKSVFYEARKDNFTGFKAPLQGLRYVRSWKKSKNIEGRVVSITLRNYGYDLQRNSRVDEWLKFANLIKGKGFIPVFIPDTDACFNLGSEFDDYCVFDEACWNLGLRASFYEDSFLNFFISSGPSALALCNKKVRYIVMKVVVDNSLEANPKLLQERGLELGQKKYNFAEDHQILSWNDDSLENIQIEFNEFLKAFEVK